MVKPLPIEEGSSPRTLVSSRTALTCAIVSCPISSLTESP